MRIRSLLVVAALSLTPESARAQGPDAAELVPAAAEAFKTSLRSAKPGEVVLTDLKTLEDVRALPLDLRRADDSPQFLLSDRPEYFRTGDGIAMQEAVRPGTVRLYVYHVPEPSGARKVIPAVLDNLSDQPLTLQMLHRGAPKPSGDYHKLAKQAMVDFLREPAPRYAVVTVPPKGRHVLDPELSQAVVTKDILVHGIYEFTIDQPARITTFQKDPDAPIDAMDALPKLPRVLAGFNPSGAGRGLFERSNIDGTLAEGAVYDTADGVRKVVVADGKTDPWLEGRDSLDTSTPATNKGNYGAMYRLKLKVKSSDGRGVALLMATNRTDSKWCNAVGAVVKVSDGKHPGGVVMLPAETPRFTKVPEACVIQTFAAPEKPGEVLEIDLLYTPPGACCLPTPILLVPIEK